MNKELFQDLIQMTRVFGRIETITWQHGQKPLSPANLAANILRHHSTATELKLLERALPTIDWSEKPAMLPAVVESTPPKRATQKPTKAPAPKRAARKATKVDPGLITVMVGPYPHKPGADQDVVQFRHPSVFIYRTAMFPLPANFRVDVKVVNAEAVARQNDKLYPYAIALTLQVTGEPAKVADWIQAFRNRARMQLLPDVARN